MCIRYICTSCQNFTVHHCESADLNQVNPTCFLPTIDPDPLTIHKRCYPCKTIEGAIIKLHHLLFRKPWLGTEGLGGEDNREEWEREQETVVNEFKVKTIDWDDVGDKELWDRLKSMRLQHLEGKEELNDGHGITGFNESEKTSLTKQDESEHGGQMKTSFWSSEEGTLVTDEKEESKSKRDKTSFNADHGEEQDDLIGIGVLFG